MGQPLLLRQSRAGGGNSHGRRHLLGLPEAGNGPFVEQLGEHAGFGVISDVAMEGPEAGLVRNEQDGSGAHRRHQNRVPQ